MEKAYVLLKEVVGGEEEDRNSSEIVAVSKDIVSLSDRVPHPDFLCVDPEFVAEADNWDYPNPVERFVIRGFDLETGESDGYTCTIFWSVEDFAANGCTISI